MIHKLLRLACAVCAGVLLAPTLARASDPVKDLENLLKPALGSAEPIDAGVLTKRVEKEILPKLKTISQLRGAYFLKDWTLHRDKPGLMKLREQIGDSLEQMVLTAAKNADAEQKIAIAMMIAEMADRELADEKERNLKFANRFVDLLIVGKKNGPSFAADRDVNVKQAAWYAIGKVTPKPNEVLRLKLREVLSSGELGPRRLAAYGLSELIKNGHNFEDFKEEMGTVILALEMARFGLRDLSDKEAAALNLPETREDEWVRGYCLQAIKQAGHIFTDYGKAIQSPIRYSDPEDPKTFDKEVVATLDALRAANRPIAVALADDNPKIRLTALQTLNQIVRTRAKIFDTLNYNEDTVLKTPPAKRVYRIELLKKYKGPDPVGYFLEYDEASKKKLAVNPDETDLHWNWEIVRTLLRPENEIRVRRGATMMLEGVTEDVESAVMEKKLAKDGTPPYRVRMIDSLRPGLTDPDILVRWSAARAMQYVDPKIVGGEVIIDLARMLIDRDRYAGRVSHWEDRDPNLSATALTSLQALASCPHAWNAIEFLKSAIIDVNNDAEFRVEAVRTLMLIKSEAENGNAQKAANSAFPQLTAVLANTDEDVRLRQVAAEALGQIGRPQDPFTFTQAITTLERALRDRDATIRQNASEALLTIRGK